MLNNKLMFAHVGFECQKLYPVHAVMAPKFSEASSACHVLTEEPLSICFDSSKKESYA